LDGESAARPETEARVVDVKVKSGDAGEAVVADSIELLKEMQDERWESFDWVDANVRECFWLVPHFLVFQETDDTMLREQTEEAWSTYENYMIQNDPEDLPQLESAIDSEDYLDAMSAPRIDPARPEMTGWAMKQNRKKQNSPTEVVDG
jgi:DNA-directed RNA polymerase